MEETRQGDAASLAAAVLDEEAARQEAQARSKEQVIFPDELLPGVNSEPVTFHEAFARGGKLMFIVLSLRSPEMLRPTADTLLGESDSSLGHFSVPGHRSAAATFLLRAVGGRPGRSPYDSPS